MKQDICQHVLISKPCLLTHEQTHRPRGLSCQTCQNSKIVPLLCEAPCGNRQRSLHMLLRESQSRTVRQIFSTYIFSINFRANEEIISNSAQNSYKAKETSLGWYLHVLWKQDVSEPSLSGINMPLNVRPEYKIYSNLLRKPIVVRRHCSAPGQWFTAKCQSWISEPNPAKPHCVILCFTLPKFPTEDSVMDRTDDSSTSNSLYKLLFHLRDNGRYTSFLIRAGRRGKPCVIRAAMWPIRLLCNEGLRCSQYIGLERVIMAIVSVLPGCRVPPTICPQLITSSLLCDREEREMERDNKYREEERIQETNLMAWLILINGMLTKNVK